MHADEKGIICIGGFYQGVEIRLHSFDFFSIVNRLNDVKSEDE